MTSVRNGSCCVIESRFVLAAESAEISVGRSGAEDVAAAASCAGASAVLLLDPPTSPPAKELSGSSDSVFTAAGALVDAAT